MADPSQQGMQDTSWRTPAFRQKVVAQIEDTMRQSGNTINKTSVEMENHVFQKATTREQYLALVARLIIHVREINSKKKADVNFGPGMGGGGMGTVGGGMQDPINALQNLTKQGPTTGMPAHPNQPPNIAGQMMGGQRPFQTYTPGGQGMQPNMPGIQSNMPPNMAPNMPPQPGMQHMIAQQRVQLGMPVMRQEFVQQPQSTQTSQHLSSMGGQPQYTQSSQSQMGVRQSSGLSFGGLTQPDTNFFTQGGNISTMSSAGPGASSFNSPITQNFPSNLTQASSAAGAAMAQSPVGGSTIAHSPATMLPSPTQVGIAPSPAQRMTGGAPSPGSVMLNTPGNPTSIPSPAQGQRPATTDEQVYLEKWKQLQKYIEPLKRMINKIEKDEDRKNELRKMKNLLNILSDSSQRLPIGTLLKCEQVLEKLDFQFPKVTTASITIPTTAVSLSSSKTEQHMCQPLLDAVASHITSPMVNHTLQRTFGPAVQALHGPPIRAPSPPPKRARTNNNQETVSAVLEGEIARLEERFKVHLDPLQHNGSKVVNLVCWLDDKNLPHVPPITVQVPENYPDASPNCDTSGDEYDATPFLQKVQKCLSSQVLSLPDKFSVTALLETWEMSVRKACAPVST